MSTKQPPCITTDGTHLKNVGSFKYLGSTISSDGTLDTEATARIQQANKAMGKLRSRVLEHKDIRMPAKLKVYNAVVLSSLLYRCKT